MCFIQYDPHKNLYHYSSQPRLLFWSTASPLPDSGFKIQDTWQGGPHLGYYLFVSQDPTTSIDKFTTAIQPHFGSKNPIHTSFAWVQYDGSQDLPHDFFHFLEITQEGAILTGLELGFNTEDRFAANNPHPEQPLNLLLKPGWSLLPHLEDSEITGFQLLYPPDLPDGAYPPQPSPGYDLYLSLLDQPGCGCLVWQGIRYDFQRDYYYGYQVQLDPLDINQSFATLNGLYLRLQPTGQAEPAYFIQLLTG